MIREVQRKDIPECVEVIRKSFQTIAEEFGFTEENAPRFTAFATTEERLFQHFDNEHRPMYVFCNKDTICGYYSLSIQNTNECELSNLAVLPTYRHHGIGKALLKHAIKTANQMNLTTMNIGIVEENTILKKWYEQNGVVHICTRKHDFFPFTCGYMKICLSTMNKEDNDMLIKDHETAMWEAAKNRDSNRFLELVNADAVMVCGGYRCTGADYSEIIKDFDCASFEISDFEIIFETADICQVHYVIETKVSKEENKDLEGKFHITTTWKKYDNSWKVVFNMDSRIIQ